MIALTKLLNPIDNIIDSDYDHVMSMDEDDRHVGGGYKAFMS